jgi:uncharacterized membrane protein YphA (DoxX/SURF4 family)
MRASRRLSAALAVSLLLVFAGAVDGVTARTRSFQSRFRTEQGKEWQVHLDHNSGRPYYFDKETGKSTWDDPRETKNEIERGVGSEPSGVFGSLFETGKVKFTGGGLGGRSRRSKKRAAIERNTEVQTSSWVEWFRGSEEVVTDDFSDYGDVRPSDSRKLARGSSARETANGVTASGRHRAREDGRYRKDIGWMDLNVDGEDARWDVHQPPKKKPFARARAPFIHGVVVMSFTAAITSGVIFGSTVLSRVIDRTGAGSVGYASAEATFLGEVTRETLGFARRFVSKTAANVESLFAFAQVVIVETLTCLTELDFPGAGRTVLRAAREIDLFPGTRALAVFCVLMYHVGESAERYGEYAWRLLFWKYAEAEAQTRGGHGDFPNAFVSGFSRDETQGKRLEDALGSFSDVGLDTSRFAKPPGGIPWMSFLATVAVTCALHGVSPRRCVVFALAKDVFHLVLGPSLMTNARPVVDLESLAKRSACAAFTGVSVAYFRKKERAKATREGPSGALNGVDAFDDEDDIDSCILGKREPKRLFFSRWTSIALLAARVCFASVFVVAAFPRVPSPRSKNLEGRIVRGTAAASLIKGALAASLTLGYEVSATSGLSALVLMFDSCARRGFWTSGGFDPEGARTHFAADAACAGGLVLLRAMGGGRYAADAHLASKKRE